MLFRSYTKFSLFVDKLMRVREGGLQTLHCVPIKFLSLHLTFRVREVKSQKRRLLYKAKLGYDVYTYYTCIYLSHTYLYFIVNRRRLTVSGSKQRLQCVYRDDVGRRAVHDGQSARVRCIKWKHDQSSTHVVTFN